MLKDGHAYYCYSSKEELDQIREESMKLGNKPKYDGKWRPENNKTLPHIPEGIKPVIRFKNPAEGSVTWEDLVKGKITINNKELDDFIVAKILKAEKHPNADRLRVCDVDVGLENPAKVVCGAPNAQEGLLTIYAPPGAVIPKNQMKLEVSKIRGVTSYGMLCSESEFYQHHKHAKVCLNKTLHS